MNPAQISQQQRNGMTDGETSDGAHQREYTAAGNGGGVTLVKNDGQQKREQESEMVEPGENVLDADREKLRQRDQASLREECVAIIGSATTQLRTGSPARRKCCRNCSPAQCTGHDQAVRSIHLAEQAIVDCQC